MVRAFGVISLEDWVLELQFSNLKVKFAKQEVIVFIIFITSPIPGSTSRSFDCLWFPLPFPCPLGLWELTFFNAWSLWQFGLVCHWIPQWWQKCCVWGPLYDFGKDFPFALGLSINGLGGFVKTYCTITFGFFSTFTLSTRGVVIIGSLALSNFISLDTLALELLSSVNPKPLSSKKGFWCASTSSSFLEAIRSTLALESL